METYTILIVLFSAIILALYVFWFIRFIRKGKRNAETNVQNISVSAHPDTLISQYTNHYYKKMIEPDENYIVTIRIEKR